MVELGVTNKNAEGYALMDGDGKTDAANFEKNLDAVMKNKETLAAQTNESNTKLANNASFATIATVVAGVIISLILGIFLSLSITKPIMMITQGANGFAIGDIELKGMDWNEIKKVVARGDELGDIGKAFVKLIEYQQDKVNIAGEIAKGNIDINVNLASDVDKLGIAFKETVSSLNVMMAQINSAVDQTASRFKPGSKRKPESVAGSNRTGKLIGRNNKLDHRNKFPGKTECRECNDRQAAWQRKQWKIQKQATSR